MVELIDHLPIGSGLQAFLISKVPNPVKSISPPGAGFQWGIEPVPPHSFPVESFAVKGDAQLTLRVTGNGSFARLLVGAWGDGKAVLDFQDKKAHAHPRHQMEGQIFFGVKGTF